MGSPINQTDIERRISVRALAGLLDDDGDGAADAHLVKAIIDEATAIAGGILSKGFVGAEQQALLFQNDAAVRGAVVDIAVGLAGRRRAEFGGGEQGGAGAPYASWRREAERVLERIASGDRRAIGENAGAPNAHANITGVDRRPPRPGFEFITGKRGRYSRPGGF